MPLNQCLFYMIKSQTIPEAQISQNGQAPGAGISSEGEVPHLHNTRCQKKKKKKWAAYFGDKNL